MRLVILVFWITALYFSQTGARAEQVTLVPEIVHSCNLPCSRIAVIFFHGFTGSRGTWLNNESQFYWPTELGDDPLIGGQIDVYRVDYETNLWSGPTFNEIGHAVAQAIDPLMIQRRYGKVVLIGHSLGGIVAEAYMMHVKLRYGHRALARFPLLITLGTPFLGSSLAIVGNLVSTNPQVRILVPIGQNDFEQYVNQAWDDVGHKHLACNAPQTDSAGLQNYAAFEDQATVGVGIVVSEESATLHATSSIGIERTHIGLPKPADRSDVLYIWVKDALLLCAAPSSTLCAVPTETCPTGDFPASSP
jgi:pimeloyl-ACP methyl ester carboxylesterase